MPNLSIIQKRVVTYISLFIVLLLSYFLLRDSTWTGSKQLHTLMEIVTSILAFIVGAMALVRFYSKRDNTFLLIGAGFIGTSFLDAYHTIVTSTFFDIYFPSSPPSLIPWSWIASRLFLSLFLWLSWVAWKREKALGQNGIIKETVIYGTVSILILISFAFFVFMPLPKAYYPELFFHRPEELIPALFFLLALIGYVQKGHWKNDVFEHWLVLSLIVGFMGQIIFMSFSGQLFDVMFDVAHLLKKLSYIFVLIGLFISMYSILRRTEKYIQELSQVTVLLQEEVLTRERAELAIQKAKENAEFRERELRAIIDTAPVGIIVINAQGIVESCNYAFEEMFDYAAEEVINHNVKMLTPEDIRPHHDGYIRRYLETGEKQVIGIGREVIGQRKDGSTFHAHLSIGEFEIAGERKFAGILHDISDRKEAEEKYRQAKEEAETANRAKSTFLANMSHELRTPLNGVLGYAQILNRDPSLNEEQRKGVNIIQRSGEHLLTLINDVLDFSKIEAGKLEYVPREFNFQSFIQDIVSLFKMRADQKGIEFIYEEIQPPISLLENGIMRLPLVICADEKRLRQILLNLLSNAVKFTDKGHVIFKVNYYDNRIRFDVEDTGFGIPEKDQKNIFLAFQQVARKNLDIEGTGLGLPITRNLVEMMGGELKLESMVGVGSLFWFEVTFDVINYTSELSHVEKKSSPQKQIIGFQGKPRKILIIDDIAENRSVLIDLLAPLGFELKEAHNFQTGLDQAQIWQPDLILMDLVMPDVDGFEATTRIRQIEAFQTTKIIMISASAFEQHQAKSLAVGCNDFIAKPVQMDELFEKLQKHLDLIWNYRQIASESLESEQTEKTTSVLVGPPTDMAKMLYELAEMGDISSILEQVPELEKMGEAYLPFANKLKELAEGFEMEALPKLIEPYIE